ncbi:MAG: hypothetical protein IKO87_00010 [Kiritimatiellae bacterium]|nr:hypothetical protein [Kiritimatiellia bacterium]
MTVDSSRRGSALLIVLGMLAFMVVSAVSFSAYMRSSRLPSSYLRRTAASRQLAKAALAEAIERLDVAIGENAYPDQRVGDQAPSVQRLSLLGAHGTSSRNYWYNNIFIGTNAFLSAEDTVSTLTLEGLAYIPPPLVNEARRYSRMSSAATWHTLGFDAGRYAYCAIDVSDCFDINRLVANGRRNSGRRRITLAHLFEKPDKHDTYDLDPSRWETFMENFRSKVNDEDDASEGRISKTKVPLVSLADWNLAANDNDSSQLPTPFCSYVENESGVAFYGGVSPKGAEASRLRSMRIVTDSFLPGLSEEQLEREKLVDLASEDGQPFQASDFDDGANVDAIFELGKNGTEGYKALISDFLSDLDMICLYDYLDYNNVPVSLALPTTERVPMVCAVTPGISTTLKCVTETLSENKDGSLRKIAYKLDGEKFCSGAISTLVAFPFRRGKERNDTFTYEACLRLFFAPPAGDFQSFRLPKATIRPTNDDDFKETGYADGVFKVALMSDTEPQFTNVQTE